MVAICEEFVRVLAIPSQIKPRNTKYIFARNLRGFSQLPRTISRETLILILRGICGGPRNSLAKLKLFHWLAGRFLAKHSQTLQRICEAIYFYIYKGREFERSSNHSASRPTLKNSLSFTPHRRSSSPADLLFSVTVLLI